jgi:hypothetical protein
LTPEEIADRLKTPGSTFPISGTVYPKQGGVFAGEGTTRRTEDDFILHLMFPVGAEAPQPKGRTFIRDDFWRFEGVIGATLPLVVEHLAPLGTRHWNNGVTSQEYHVHTIGIDLVRLAQSPVRKVSASSASAVNLKENDDKLPESFDWEPEGVEGIGQSALSTADSGAASTTQSVMTRIAETEQSTQPSTPNEEPRKRSAYATGTWIHAVVLNFPSFTPMALPTSRRKMIFLESRLEAPQIHSLVLSTELNLVWFNAMTTSTFISSSLGERRKHPSSSS